MRESFGEKSSFFERIDREAAHQDQASGGPPARIAVTTDDRLQNEILVPRIGRNISEKPFLRQRIFSYTQH